MGFRRQHVYSPPTEDFLWVRLRSAGESEPVSPGNEAKRAAKAATQKRKVKNSCSIAILRAYLYRSNAAGNLLTARTVLGQGRRKS